jgi:RimJ/RimL family protein N-acetyltransferase
MKHLVFADHKNSRSMLCVPGKKHAALLTGWVNNPEIRQFLLRCGPTMLETEEAWLSQMAADATRGTMTHAMFLIVDKDGNKPIGTIGLSQIDWKNRHALTGTFIGKKDMWGKGYGTDAKMLLLNWAFNELALNSIESHVIEFNRRSVAYSKKCGYKETGRLRQRHFRNGKYYDEVLLDVLAKEWHPLWQKFEKGSFHKARR